MSLNCTFVCSGSKGKCFLTKKANQNWMMDGLSRFIILISKACDDFMEFSF